MKILIRKMTLAAMLCGALGLQAAVVEPARSDSKTAPEEAQQLLKERNDARPKAEAAEQKLRDSGRRPAALGFEKAKALRDEQAAAGDKATAYASYAKTAKEMETQIKRQVDLGQQPLIAADIARFERLQAEVDLARLMGRLPAQEEAATTPARERAFAALRAEQTKHDAGKSTLYNLCQVAKDLRNVEVQTSANAEQRIAAHQRYVTLIRQLKDETDRRIEIGTIAPLEGKLAAQLLKEAETELLRARDNK